MNAICFGEVLIDQFPTYSRVGGAPLNVALRLKSFGVDVNMISSIGNDKEGKEIMDFINASGLNSQSIQTYEEAPTGIVDVKISENKNANYDIKYPSAWDHIFLNEVDISLVKNSDVFIYGSLSARDFISKTTLLNILPHAKFRVFDVNLRPPHYSFKDLSLLMNDADFIKMNDEELYEIVEHFGSKYNSFDQNIKFISDITNTDYICVTKGAFGASLYVKGEIINNNGYKVDVVDTVGSGDSFLASLIFKLLGNSKAKHAINFACATGALVASCKGANPEFTESEIKKFIRS